MAQWVKDPAVSLLWAWVTAVVQVQCLAQELPNAMGEAMLGRSRTNGEVSRGKEGAPTRVHY